MKKTLPCIIALLFLFAQNESFSQTSVVSSNGYVVNIVVQPVQIIPTSNSCTYGYNYNVKLNYSITFTGTNIPSSLHTLQGTLGCGSNTHFFNLPNTGGTGNVTSQSNVWRPLSDCGTATVSSLNCNTVNIQIQGPGISNRTITFVVTPIPLPVKMVDFAAESLKDKVKLSWATASEQNNDFFTVERSENGSTWTEIKKVKGAGNSSSLLNYIAYDQNPVNGTAYYRIKQTDLDGKATYSETRSAKYTGASTISIFPVPNTGNTINIKGISDTEGTLLTVLDGAGVAVFKTTLTGSSAKLPNLSAGLYVISLNNKLTGEITNLRYIKI